MLLLVNVMFLLAGMTSESVSVISLLRAIIVDSVVLLMAFLSSVSLLTILSETPDANGETTLNTAAKHEKAKIPVNSKIANNNIRPP
jgi:hypothetical protein